MNIGEIIKMECPSPRLRGKNNELPFDQLKIGESFEVQFSKGELKPRKKFESGFKSRITYWQNKLGINLRFRIIDVDSEDNVITIRVFRVADKPGNIADDLLEKFRDIAHFGLPNFDPEILIQLIRGVDGWLEVLNTLIPPANQSEDLWVFIAEEGGNLSIYEIPVRFHTDRVLGAWIGCDLCRIQDVPKECWTKNLKGITHRHVQGYIDVANSFSEMVDLQLAVNNIRKERNIPDGQPVLKSPRASIGTIYVDVQAA